MLERAPMSSPRPLLALSFLALATACSAASETDAEQSSEALGETSRVELRLAAFIPCQGIDTFGVFDGDGRSFGYDVAAESSRVLLDVTVDPAGADRVTPRGFPSKRFPSS